MYIRKTRDSWTIEVNYGYGLEYEITEYSKKDIKVQEKAYRENCKYPFRIKKKREKIN